MLGTLEALFDLARSSTEGIERAEVDVSALALQVMLNATSGRDPSPCTACTSSRSLNR